MSFNSPSRKCGISEEKEILFRQLASIYIEKVGKNLTTYIAINTAIVYMHRFYMQHPFTIFPWEKIVAPSIFLAAKIEESPIRLNLLIAKANDCLHGKQPANLQPDINECTMMENFLLSTLGFELTITQPHPIIILHYEKLKIPKHISKAAYFLATCALQLTVICTKYNASTIACFVLHLASKWCRFAIPMTEGGQEWFKAIESSVTLNLLDTLTKEFEEKMNKCVPTLKEHIAIIYNSCKRTSLENVPSAQKSLYGKNNISNETSLKRIRTMESKIEELRSTSTSTITKPVANPSNEPPVKVYRKEHSKDSRIVQPGVHGSSSSHQKVHAKDPRTVILKHSLKENPNKIPASLPVLKFKKIVKNAKHTPMDLTVPNLVNGRKETVQKLPEMHLNNGPTEKR